MHMPGENMKLRLCDATEIQKLAATLKLVRFELRRKGLMLEDLLSI